MMIAKGVHFSLKHINDPYPAATADGSISLAIRAFTRTVGVPRCFAAPELSAGGMSRPVIASCELVKPVTSW
jgi:hypothetical protein